MRRFLCNTQDVELVITMLQHCRQTRMSIMDASARRFLKFSLSSISAHSNCSLVKVRESSRLWQINNSALAWSVGIGHKSRGAVLSYMDVIPRDIGLDADTCQEEWTNISDNAEWTSCVSSLSPISECSVYDVYRIRPLCTPTNCRQAAVL